MKNILYLLLISAPIFSMHQHKPNLRLKSPCDRVKRIEARRLEFSALIYEANCNFSVPLYYGAIDAQSILLPTKAMKMTKFYITHLITLEVAERAI